MRALFDANIYISYLLAPSADSPPVGIVEAAVGGACQLLVTEGVLAELRDKTSTKPWLAAHITPEQVARLERILIAVAEAIPEIGEPYPEVGSDRKDDYLYAHSILANADFLVSGDKGVLRMRRVGDVDIVSPAEFMKILEVAGRA